MVIVKNGERWRTRWSTAPHSKRNAASTLPSKRRLGKTVFEINHFKPLPLRLEEVAVSNRVVINFIYLTCIVTATTKRSRATERRQSTVRTTHSRDVHLSMLPDLSENLSNEERTWEEIMQIKAMPVLMSQKREIKARLQNATKLRLQGFEQLQWKQRKVWHRFRIRFGELIGKLELWQSSMKKIEGNFGTGVVSYFLFLRWLLFLNLGISIFVILFLILPEVLFIEEETLCEIPNSTTCCSHAYLTRNSTSSNWVLDVIQGTGWMERTILFYGVYSNQIYTYYIRPVNEREMYYNMKLAYILIPITWALFSLGAIVKSAAKGFKERLIENEGQFYMYCSLVFGGWDFCIHNDKSAKIKHKALYNEIRGCLEEEKLREEKQLRSRESQILLYIKRLFINILVLAILFGSGVLIYVVFNTSLERLNERSDGQSTAPQDHAQTSRFLNNHSSSTPSSEFDYGGNVTTSEKLTIFKQYTLDSIYFSQFENLILEFLPSICIVMLNIFVPELFSFLVGFENYMPAVVLKITLFRTIFLRLSSLAVLLSQIYMRVTSPNRDVCSYDTNLDSSTLECWETYVGQQLYKLILTDFAVQFVTTFIINLPRAMLARHTESKCLKLVGEQEFYLPKHVLDIVYTQTIIWMGTFFCPFLPIIGFLFCFVIFYVKKFTCLVNCTPSATVYRASRSKSMFMFVLLLSFVISISPVAYSIAELLPSMNCGPFRGYSNVWSFMIATFDGFPYIVREIVFLLGTSTFAVPAFALLLLLLYYYWAVATANRHMVTVLKNQLVLEGHDKQFLLNRLSAFIRQHQRRCERAKNRASFADESSIRQSSR
ncbi:Transmembrane channel-like protein 7 [Eumeta japonica]|uniref:Transmembrane channel-like protein 7 n=1 Tax=Eumeta variegata TaxID=151549 RepID=A0A4C2AC31_EUMVA|nr:Transmembrane channel-like protein 7 [Eumeta japonica]